MVELPFADPGTPDTRSPARLLLWAARHQLRTLAAAITFGILWMLAQALMPFAIGQAIEQGIVDEDSDALAFWVGVLLALGATQAVTGVMRHRLAVSNWLQASFRFVQVVGHHVARTGSAVRGRHSTGEVVATVSSDALFAGNSLDIMARFSGAIAAYVLVAVILLSSSLVLGVIVLVGVPVLVLGLGVVIRPLQARQREQRRQVGALTALGADTAAGLRVLRGIGGEQAFLDRYREQSQALRSAGVRVSVPQSTLAAAEVFLPGLFVVLVTWIGARFALSGRIGPGELVAFYGYAAFLVIPLRTAGEAVDKVTRSLVSARRMLDVLTVEGSATDPQEPAAEPEVGAPLRDEATGLEVPPGRLTCVVTARPDEAAELADRLGGFTPDGGIWLGDVRLVDLPRAVVRRRIVVSEADPLLFSGSLRRVLDPWSRADDDTVRHAIWLADAQDVLDALPEELDTVLEERGRSLSGGQRQRVVLARALLAGSEILVLVEPTSAVDAHTEARIAHRLHDARAGRTTVVFTASPLVLDGADHVIWIDGGRVAGAGSHRALLAQEGYRDIVTRGEDE